MATVREHPALIITADDYGYSPLYDEGIVEAATARAVDSVSVMVKRGALNSEPLLATGVELGLHLELPEKTPAAAEPVAALRELERQLEAFQAALGRWPAYLDGHRHCHAREGIAEALGREAAHRGLPVRSIDADHRRVLRDAGAATPDKLIGRYSEEPDGALPVELAAVVEGEGGLPDGITEWMVHPGHPDPESGSGFDQAREEDLDLLLSLCLLPALTSARLTHAAALG
jgi:predicted glycoside hydrolase/deacetylase ChbG (UPF0249 family)